MARLGTKRVSDVLDYERDIMGKRLIRLRAGVGAGKNHWVRHLPKTNLDLQVLMITSRKNTAEAEAVQIGSDCKIHISQLIDIRDKSWFEDVPGNLIVCTNAYIEYFFRHLYDKFDSRTHLWEKFDLIVVDEFHSLTDDTTFSNSVFYVERFIRNTLRFNPTCDIVAMSGTPESSDWLFADECWSTNYANIDIYDECIHLVPDTVYIMDKAFAIQRIINIWQKKHRIVYFVNTVKDMAELIDQLLQYGIPLNQLGIAFSKSDHADLLPDSLVKQKESLRQYIISNQRIPPEIKIFITTAQNKEGISILDDDIKIMFAESHYRADLEQMAGRVRGNPDTGTGLHALVVIADAKQPFSSTNYVAKELDRRDVVHCKDILENHRHIVENSGKQYKLESDIQFIYKNHNYIRYCNINEDFYFYYAREQADHQKKVDADFFQMCIDTIDQPHCYTTDSSHPGQIIPVTGRYLLQQDWFPYSKLYYVFSKPPLDVATIELMSFLEENQYYETQLNTKKQQDILKKIHDLISQYGAATLGFSTPNPKTLGPALKRFGLSATSVNHKCTDKIIHAPITSTAVA